MQFRSIIRIVGLLLALFSVSMLAPALVALIYRDGAGVPFVSTFFVLLLCGGLFWFPNRHHKHELKARDGFLIVVLFWTVIGSAGALPFLLAADPNISVTDAFFESFSALTTTGATVIVGLDELPKAILFYRQFLQWFGGMGIIVLAVAILPVLGIGGMQLYRAEIPGPVKDTKVTPRIAETAKALWYIYLSLTIACASAFWLAGMSLFDAICHSFSTIAIGGFSTHDASMGYFDSYAINLITVVFLLISSCNFTLHYAAFATGGVHPKYYWRDPEFRAFFVIQVLLFVICFSVLLKHHSYDSFYQAFDQAPVPNRIHLNHSGFYHHRFFGLATLFTCVIALLLFYRRMRRLNGWRHESDPCVATDPTRGSGNEALSSPSRHLPDQTWRQSTLTARRGCGMGLLLCLCTGVCRVYACTHRHGNG